jgi:hypothetical protein
MLKQATASSWHDEKWIVRRVSMCEMAWRNSGQMWKPDVDNSAVFSGLHGLTKITVNGSIEIGKRMDVERLREGVMQCYL